MTDKFSSPFGTYTGVAVLAAPGQAEIIANLASFLLLFGVVMTGSTTLAYNPTASVPDFNKLSDGMRRKIAEEILAIAAKVDAMPVA